MHDSILRLLVRLQPSHDFAVLTFSSGRRPRLNTASEILPAVTLSVRPTLSAMLVAAIVPQATASPWRSLR